MNREEQRAHDALAMIIPRIEATGFRWVTTGGFACYVYGVQRPLTDIDIDLDTSKDAEAFKSFFASLAEYTTQPLEHFVDANYDNYNFEITVGGQVLDMCPMAEMNVIDRASGEYKPFYADGFPRVEERDFYGLSLPLLAKDLIIKNKEMLAAQRDSDRADIEALKKSEKCGKTPLFGG